LATADVPSTRYSRSRAHADRMIVDKRLTPLQTNLGRAALVVLIFVLWQYLPQSLFLRKFWPVLDPFFLSSPIAVAHALWSLMTATGGMPSIWPNVIETLRSTFLGAGIGILTGGVTGLLLSNDRRLRQVLTPFINGANSMPKIALIPVIIIIFGPSALSSVVTSVMIVFFAVFFNAYAGGRSVPIEMLQSARLLGARPIATMWHIRLMYVVLWTFEALPNAISHGLLGVVTAEILSGSGGLGQLIVQALSQVDANLTFAIVVLLSVIGIILVGAADMLRGRVLHWWPGAL
jgi:NitT/TauT family transport system permease protein